MTEGESFKFIGKSYSRGKLFDKGYLQIGDEVIIHPIPGKSRATKSYEALVVRTTAFNGGITELSLMGIGDNRGWHGALLNEYGFSRLELVRHKI